MLQSRSPFIVKTLGSLRVSCSDIVLVHFLGKAMDGVGGSEASDTRMLGNDSQDPAETRVRNQSDR